MRFSIYIFFFFEAEAKTAKNTRGRGTFVVSSPSPCQHPHPSAATHALTANSVSSMTSIDIAVLRSRRETSHLETPRGDHLDDPEVLCCVRLLGPVLVRPHQLLDGRVHRQAVPEGLQAVLQQPLRLQHVFRLQHLLQQPLPPAPRPPPPRPPAAPP